MEEPKVPEPVHEPGTDKGEDISEKMGKNPGYQDTGFTGEAKRPSGKSNEDVSSRVASSKPIDPDSPTLPAP